MLVILTLLTLMAGCGAEKTDGDEPMSGSENNTTAVTDRTDGSDGEIDETQENTGEGRSNMINLQVGDTVFTATLEDNSTAEALMDMLAAGPVTIEMSDYANMEKVGPFVTSLPRNDEHITTEPGDLILYQGSSFVIYYAPNTWTFTRIGRINDVTGEELKQALGYGEVTVTLSLAQD